MFNERFQQHHIVCITVDVEDAGNAEEQLIMRRSLHAFIGIHGAQLTQGIFLQSHRLILELLPHISPGDWGGWVAMTEAPTPQRVYWYSWSTAHPRYFPAKSQFDIGIVASYFSRRLGGLGSNDGSSYTPWRYISQHRSQSFWIPAW
jgi:hypothetical protein